MTALRKKLFLLFVALQILVLVVMVVQRERIIRSKENPTVLLKIIPRDPRSLLSGDHVILRYEISTLPKSMNTNVSFQEGDTVYVAVQKQDDSKFSKAIGLGNDYQTLQEEFSHAIILYGKIAQTNASSYTITYGIENYFVRQGTGYAIETTKADDMSMEIKVDPNGTCVIYRFLIQGRDVNQNH